MNVRSMKESIEFCRRSLSAEAYQEYSDALKRKDMRQAQKASDFCGKIDDHFVQLQKILENYLDEMK